MECRVVYCVYVVTSASTICRDVLRISKITPLHYYPPVLFIRIIKFLLEHCGIGYHPSSILHTPLRQQTINLHLSQQQIIFANTQTQMSTSLINLHIEFLINRLQIFSHFDVCLKKHI